MIFYTKKFRSVKNASLIMLEILRIASYVIIAFAAIIGIAVITLILIKAGWYIYVCLLGTLTDIKYGTAIYKEFKAYCKQQDADRLMFKGDEADALDGEENTK